MIDIKLLQSDFEKVANKYESRGVDVNLLDKLKTLNLSYKNKRFALEQLQEIKNRKSQEFGTLKREKRDVEAETLKKELDENKNQIAILEDEVSVLEEELNSLIQIIPNLFDDDVPLGVSEDDNVELKKILTPKEFNFTPKEHWELAEINGWIDFERGVKISKSRFSIMASMGAKLERALINYMLDFNSERGFSEFCVPHIVNYNTLFGTGQLPKFQDDLFKIDGEELYLIPTAEVPLTNIYADEILEAHMLPLKLTAYTPCFRKEAGSAGRDTRGIIRQHQFDKVEIVAITKPEESDKIFDEMVNCASDLLSSLGLPHRLMMLCSGDMGFSASKTIDLEVWLPSQNRYREISSVSNTRDFQARRAKIRFKDGKKNRLVHTLNGSSLAVGRTVVAIMENYQNKDGTITIPEVLRKYLKNG